MTDASAPELPPEKPAPPPPPDKPEVELPPAAPDKPEIVPPPKEPEIVPPPAKPDADPAPKKPEIVPPPAKPEIVPPPKDPPDSQPPPRTPKATALEAAADAPAPEKAEDPPAPPIEAPAVIAHDAPEIKAVTPAEGPLVGGMEVTISGASFERGCAVEIAGAAVAEVLYDSDTAIRVVMPATRAAGPVAITVVNPTGLAHCVQAAFVYRRSPPRIDAVSPSSGPSAGGTRLSIKGADFGPGSSVFVCGIAAPMTFKSSEEIEVTTPAVPRDGLVDVRVVNGDDDQAVALEKAFRYEAAAPPPSISAVSPNRGAQAGGIKVAILGEDMACGVVVRFGGVQAETKFLTRKEISAIVPARQGAGEVDVEVRNPDGASATLESAFTYEAKPAPSITSVEPKNGPTTGGTKVVIEGVNFSRESQVYIGREYPKDIVVRSATEIHIVTPARSTPGVVDVEVTVPGTPKAVKANAFRYDASPPPSISSVSPNRVGTAGGAVVTVSGAGFLKDSAVLVDKRPVKAVKFVDKSTLEFKAPGGEDGKMADVTVKNPDGKEATAKRAFMFDPRYG